MINVAVIGAGPWGRTHIRLYKDMDNANLKIVAGDNKNNLKNIDSDYSVKTT